ncbi:MAG: hypothetical protein JOS17DRAFT_770062 [Linnemannia elongata]|nr:MAG: hypothetical protein JOS17DRAFT_770062 [Linnemannia elongata]
MSFPIHARMHSHVKCLITLFLQPITTLPRTSTSLAQHAFSTKGTTPTTMRTIKSSRDSPTSSSTSISGRYRKDGSAGVSDLRKTVMDEVAIPGRYQQYFRPDKRSTRKAEGSVLSMDRSRSPKKVSAAKWSQHDSNLEGLVLGGEPSLDIDKQESTIEGGSRPSSVSSRTSRRGFDNVGWRALGETYARDVLPHPYFHKDYLDITEIKLLPDRKTFQLWYRPKPDDRVSAAMLARHAPRSSSASSRLVFQLVRQSDRQADMSDLWRKLEEQVDLHSGQNDISDVEKQEEEKASTRVESRERK